MHRHDVHHVHSYYEKLLPDFRTELTKYSESELTSYDIEILDQIVMKYMMKFYALTREYRDPKDYAKKVILKKMQSDSDLAILLTLGYAKNDEPDHLFRSGEINQRLANDIRESIELDYHVDDGNCKSDHFLHPPDLRQKVLKELEEQGVFIHLEGQKEINLHYYNARGPGKKSSCNKDGETRGGNPSAYIVSQNLANLRKLLEKSSAVEYIHAKIIRSGLAFALTKYGQLAFLHAARMDKKIFLRIIRAGANLVNASWTQENTRNLEEIFWRLQACTDNQLQECAERIATYLINNQDYHRHLSFLNALIKL